MGALVAVLGSRPMAKRVLLKRIGVEKRISSGGGLERKKKWLIGKALFVVEDTFFE